MTGERTALRAAEWAEVVEDHANERRPLTETKLRNLAAYLRAFPCRVDELERRVDELARQVEGGRA
jgi:hypothetical protein